MDLFKLCQEVLGPLPVWISVPLALGLGFVVFFLIAVLASNSGLAGIGHLLGMGLGVLVGAVSVAGAISGALRRPSAVIDPPIPSASASAREWDLELVQAIEWKRFEELTVDLLNALGLRANLTPHGADGGVDVEVRDPNDNELRMIGQCKAWPEGIVGVKPVRELFGVKTANGVAEAAFFTNGTFTREARVFALANGVDLYDGAKMIDMIRSLPNERQMDMLATATAGDFTTPSCPKCETKMVPRQSGAYPPFWGCARYPRCRGKLGMRKSSR